MQQVKALPLPETKQEREARLSSALGVPGDAGIPSCMPSAAVPAPIEEDEDMHHTQDDMPNFDLGEDEANIPVRPRLFLPVRLPPARAHTCCWHHSSANQMVLTCGACLSLGSAEQAGPSGVQGVTPVGCQASPPSLEPLLGVERTTSMVRVLSQQMALQWPCSCRSFHELSKARGVKPADWLTCDGVVRRTSRVWKYWKCWLLP